MPDSFFDVVIVGTSVSGLALGALCARKGYTVLVVGQDARPATFAVGTSLVSRSVPLIYGLSTSSQVRSFFRELGLSAELRNRPETLDPYLQVITPGSRYELSLRPDHTQAELEREFPEAAREIISFMQSVGRDARDVDEFLAGLPLLPPSNFVARWKLNRYVRRHPVHEQHSQPLSFPPELRFSSALAAMVLFLTQVHSRPLPPFALRRMVQNVLGGFTEFPQGIDGLKRMFTDRVAANGGLYWPERSVEQVLVKWRKAREVVVQRPRRTVGCRLLVGNCPPRAFFNLIPPELQDATLHSFIKSLQPAWYNYVVNFVVRRDLLPEAMARNVLVTMYPKQEFGGPNTLWIYHRPPEEMQAEAGTVTLVVSCRVRAKDMPLDAPGFQALNERILNTLEWALPFIREKLVRVHTSALMPDRETGQERVDPAELQEVYDVPVPGALGLSAVPCRARYRNILMLGDHCLGGLGLEGAILGAQAAFAWTEKHVVLKKMIKK